MSDDELVLQVIRETLEGLMSRDIVSAVIFEALEVLGRDLPQRSELLPFLRGPLRDAMLHRADHAASDRAIEQIAAVLGLSDHPAPPRPAPSRDAAFLSTTQLKIYKEVRVAVLSRSPSMARKLQAALDRRVITIPLQTTTRLGDVVAGAKPNVILIDATDPPSDEPASLRPVLFGLPPGTPVAVWGGQEPYAKALRAELGRDPEMLVVNYFDREEGVDPLFDLIRSRMA